VNLEEEVKRQIEEAAGELADCLEWSCDEEEVMECLDEFLKVVFEAVEDYMRSVFGEEGREGVGRAVGEQKAARDMPQVRQARS
jgi:DNA-binding phage protein